MARRLIKILLIFLILICCVLTPILLLRHQFIKIVEENKMLLAQVSAKFVESQVLKKIEDSLRMSNQVPVNYIELAKKVGGVFLYDENLKKIVVCIRKEQQVQASLVSLTDISIPTTYFVTDTAGKIVATSEIVAIGETLSGIIAIQEVNKPIKTKYKGHTAFAFNTVSPIYGFSVITCVHIEDIWWNFLLPFVLFICIGLTILLIFLLEHYKSKLLSVRKLLEKFVEGSTDKESRVKDKEISKIIDKLSEDVQRKNEILRKTVQELESLKQTLEKIREKRS